MQKLPKIVGGNPRELLPDQIQSFYERSLSVTPKHRNCLRWLTNHAGLIIADDDAWIQAMMVRKLIPSKEQWSEDVPKDGGCTMGVHCDGVESAIIFGYSNHPQAVKNGYEAIIFQTNPVVARERLFPGFAKTIMETACRLVGFEAGPNQIVKCRDMIIPQRN